MNNFIIENFNKSLQTGFVDKSLLSEVLYQPELIVNNTKPRKKVLSTLINELEKCEEFNISVAFATTGGVATLINQFKSLEDRNIHGKILVSQYLNFTQPEALKRLSQFKNIELRIAVKENSHSKGYIFRTAGFYNLIIGSSNLTQSALATNKEWNLKVSAVDTSGIVEKVLNEFNQDFNLGIKVTPEYIRNYERIYTNQFLSYRYDKEDDTEDQLQVITPNSMQAEALENIENLRNKNNNKALLISATGTGKTFLSAFDSKSFNPSKLLFVVHRLNIAKAAMATFKKVFGGEKSMGLYSGNNRDLDKDFIFSTIQTISKIEHLCQFDKSHFDYIIIDESHRSGASSYIRLIDFFKPQFLLGMTATPERTDGNDIYSLFDHNIAYEIRLNRAMEENMISPFHYYGVSDLTVNNQILENDSDFNLLTADERVKRIIEKIEFYGSDNGIPRGLIFCSRKNEAIELSEKFNKKGYKSLSLTGENSEEERESAIKRLESDNISEKIDYIFTVDIFNEGVDIPKINQIIMIRPTESAIVFVQQLGRGLRKIAEKSYLTVIDFIGNYKNNYMIPVALYGDTSFNKDTLRKLISEGSRTIPGVSTINFDEITKERIYASIDSANMRLLSDLKNDYTNLKNKLGRIPMMMDFIKSGSRDPFLYVDYSKSYFNFIDKIENDAKLELNLKSRKLLELFSKEINNAKRVEESIILKKVMEYGNLKIDDLKNLVRQTYKYDISNETIKSCVSNINFKFIREKKDGKLISAKEIYRLNVINCENGVFSFREEFKKILSQPDFEEFLMDSVNYSIYTFSKNFDSNIWINGFHLYRKYSRKDVFRILNFDKNPVAQNVGGYLISADNKFCPIFVNYHKADDISESTKYEDEFLNNREFDWMSKSNRKLKSKDVQSIIGKNGKIRLPLFIKKNNDEGTDFYFMGDIKPQLDNILETKMNSNNGKKVSVVKIRFDLDHPVSDIMYQYLSDNVDSKKIATISQGELEIERNDSEIMQLRIDLPEYKSIPVIQIPFYDFYAAAGSFSEMQSEKDFRLINLPERFKVDKDYFACKVIGESMNKVIPNGSNCLFKKYSGGSRNGKIVLVENLDKQDPDFNSAFTVKKYFSEKILSEEEWMHKKILLKPLSYDVSYKDIIISEVNSSEMRIVGEFIEVINFN